MLLCELTLHDRSDCMQNIFTRQIVSRCDLCLSGRFLISLLIHDICTGIAQLNPGIGMDTVIDTVMTRLVATGHPTVSSIHDCITAKCRDIALPEIDSILYRLQIIKIRNTFFFRSLLQVFIL